MIPYPSMSQKTFYPDLKTIQDGRRWHSFDAQGQVVGRLATRVASLLKGKHKPSFTPSIDCGDFVIVTNVEKIKWTGNKIDQKTYFRHSGYAGGAKVIPLKRQMERDPRKALYLAVKRMLDSNRFRDRHLSRLKIYVGNAHPHAAQLSVGTGSAPKDAAPQAEAVSA